MNDGPKGPLTADWEIGGQGRTLRNCLNGNFSEEPGCRGDREIGRLRD